MDVKRCKKIWIMCFISSFLIGYHLYHKLCRCTNTTFLRKIIFLEKLFNSTKLRSIDYRVIADGGVIDIADQPILQNRKCPDRGEQEEQQRPKTMVCGSRDPTLTSLHSRTSTITCSDRFDKQRQYRHHRITNTHRADPIENLLKVNPINACAEVNLHNPSQKPLSNALCSEWVSHKSL